MDNLYVMHAGMQWRVSLMQARPPYGGGYPKDAVAYIEVHDHDTVDYFISGFVDRTGGLFQVRTGSEISQVRQAIIKGGA